MCLNSLFCYCDNALGDIPRPLPLPSILHGGLAGSGSRGGRGFGSESGRGRGRFGSLYRSYTAPRMRYVSPVSTQPETGVEAQFGAPIPAQIGTLVPEQSGTARNDTSLLIRLLSEPTGFGPANIAILEGVCDQGEVDLAVGAMRKLIISDPSCTGDLVSLTLQRFGEEALRHISSEIANICVINNDSRLSILRLSVSAATAYIREHNQEDRVEMVRKVGEFVSRIQDARSFTRPGFVAAGTGAQPTIF